ncbi:MAG: YdcF family protein [Rhodospirillaceae bacterium]|jgi:uncharacterized SAM-binding protein YcdF (DUF218 family)|nr:YdcF family protein [Rhodospirillaceae bacterium]
MRWKEPETFDVIVVLGAAQMPDGSPGPVIERRVAKAVQLWQAGRAPYLLMSGGKTVSDISEAETMAEVALASGIDAEAILLEDRSTRTIENAAFTVEMIRGRGWKDVLIVTDDFHMPRAEYCYRSMRIPVWSAKVKNPMSKRIFYCWCKEIVGRTMYPRQVRAYHGRW